MSTDREFQFDDYYEGWKTLLAIGSYEFKIVFENTFFETRKKLNKLLKKSITVIWNA